MSQSANEEPRPLEPVYPVSQVNEPIPLHQGGIRLRQGPHRVEGNGLIALEWLPFPAVRYSLTKRAAGLLELLQLQDANYLAEEASVETLGPTNPAWVTPEG